MDKIEELLTRGVDNIYPAKQDLEKLLRGGKKLKLYQGFDPTGTQLHIGHMIGFRKLRQWQELGHEVIFLIGDGTGQAGDPSGKLKAREKFFNRVELRKNAEDYIKQASKIVRFDGRNPIRILYNGDWLNKLGFVKILDIIGHLSLQQLLERDLFQERLRKNETVNMREFIYPILQGYDSVAMQVDLEIGGSDQLFNMLVGRQLSKDYLNKEKFVMTVPLLTDSEGRKIGKTEGNVIGLTDAVNDLFAKIMALPDEIIIKGLEYLTDIPVTEIQTIQSAIEKGDNPINYKKQLAFEIIRQLHSKEAAREAAKEFETIVQNKEIADESISEYHTDLPKENIVTLLFHSKSVDSKSKAKQLIEQGGIEIEEQKITDINHQVDITNNLLIKVGKRKFLKIKTK